MQMTVLCYVKYVSQHDTDYDFCVVNH